MRHSIKRLVVGDWSDFIRDPIDLIRVIFVLGTIYALFIGNFDWLIKIGLGCLAVLIVRLLDVPRWLDAGFCLAVALQVVGNIWDLFNYYYYYDKVVHLLFPVFGGPMLYVLFTRLSVFEEEISRQADHWKLRTFLIISFFGIVASTCWEMIEFLIDINVPAPIQHNNVDTVTDLMVSSLGSLIGGAITTLMIIHRTPLLRRKKLN